MKLADLERHLRRKGGELYREVKDNTARAICKQLEIAAP
jgi:hypothetical protein